MTMTRRLVALMALLVVLPSLYALLSYGDEDGLTASTAATDSQIRETKTSAGTNDVQDLLVQSRGRSPGDRGDALAELRRVKIASRALSHVRSRYVDPQRVEPREMMEAGMQAVAHHVPEMLTEVTRRDDKGVAEGLIMRIAKSSVEFDLAGLTDLYRLNWTLLRAMRFVADELPDDVPAGLIEYVAVNGMLSTLDPYSNMLDPEAYRDMRTNTGGRFGGLGIRLLALDGVLTIVGVIASSPARKAGLQENDEIIQVDGEDTVNMSLDDAVDRLRGEVGAPVRLMIRRKSWPKPRQIVVVRAVIHLQSVEWRVLDYGVGYARIKNFQRGTATEFSKALSALKAKGAKVGLVLDLRRNPGGLLDEAIKVCDLLMGRGPVVITVAGAQRRREVRSARAKGTDETLPVAVLVNRRSASASEIVAGALKHSNRALVLGQRTFGKATVQVPFEIGEGALKLTVSKYLVPGDISIQDRGVIPDIALRFISVKRSGIRRDHAGRQKQRDQSASPQRYANAGKGRPSHTMQLVLPSHRRKQADVDRETIAEFEQREPIRRAARLIRVAGSNQASRMLSTAKPHIAEMQAGDDQALSKQLARVGVDWRAGARVPQPKLRLTVSADDINPVVKAGAILRIPVTLHNDGNKPLFRLHVFSRSDDDTLDRMEQAVGRLGPHSSRTVTLQTHISRRHVSTTLPVTLIASQAGRPLDIGQTVTVQMQGRNRPRLSFRYKFDDSQSKNGNHNGLLEVGEEASLHVDVRNDGKAKASSVIASLQSLSGQHLHLVKGRVRIGTIAAGEQVTATFPVRGVKKTKQMNSTYPGALLEAKLSLVDTSVGYRRRARLYIPRGQGQDAIDLSEEVSAQNTRVTRRVLGLLKQAAKRWNRPPEIELLTSELLPASNANIEHKGCDVRVHGRARFEQGQPLRRFVTVSVQGAKQAYQTGDGEEDLQFHAQLRLDTGLNRVTIRAQAGTEVMTRRKLLIHCPERPADEKESPKQEPR